MYGDSSRKPSGSSTHSSSHSPTASPNSVQPPRKITPTTAGNMLNVGMPGANGRKTLVNSPGWQVWDSGSPSSRRNPSISSATSGNELSASQGDPNYRANFGEAWPTSRPTSGNWDDAHGSPQKKDLTQLESALNIHSRQRQSVPFSGPRIDDRSPGSKKGHLSPQRYENGIGKDPASSRYASGTSPTRAFVANPYNNQQSVPPPTGNAFDPTQKQSSGVEDLSLALRGMAVEDDFTVHANRQQTPSGQTINSNNQTMRAPPSMPQPQRGPYPSYPTTDYGGYYGNPAGRDTYLEYPYGFEAYSSDPALFPSPALANAVPASGYPGIGLPSYGSVSDMRPGMFYDYATPRPPASQYFYPSHPQPIMYPAPHSPMIPSQLPNSNPATLNEKKRELSYTIQQQLASQTMMYGAARTSPGSRIQTFGNTGLEFASSQQSGMGGPIYGPGGVHIYPHGLRAGRRDGGHPALSMRSPVLDEFRTNKARKWELQDIFGYVVEFSGDQHGSRFIQQKLETSTNEEKQAIFDEIVPANTLHLMQDVFGNYVIQKLFEYGSPVHKAILANTMEGHVLALSLQLYGCRVVQKAIEYTPPERQALFVGEIESHVLECVQNANGNHVIQKMIERISPDLLGFIGAFKGHVGELSMHTYGCRVLQRCLEYLPEDRTRPLLDELHNHTLTLIQNSFGNYVVQFVLEHGQLHDRNQVLKALRGQMLSMSRHKFASNVCEKALLCADPDNRRVLIEELMTPDQEGVNPIVMMMKDQYANYVLQRALAVVDGHQKEQLSALIRPHLLNMRKHSSAYSKHLAAIEKLLDQAQPHEQTYSAASDVILSGTHSPSSQ